jgi:predicted AAA+ superfamily ATPase
MVNRPEYLKKLQQFMHSDLVKVITGVRRCGKSTLLGIFQEYLLEHGVFHEQILSINFENADFEELTEYKNLYKYVKSCLVPEKMNYVFLDEIQNVRNFQKAVDSLYLLKNLDIYITGSNAYMLSGELATLLSGRYVTVNMLPLSFKEFISAHSDKSDLSRKYRDYLTNSSFPYALEFNGNRDLIRDYLSGIYSTIVLKDIVARRNIANVSLLESVIRFMFANIGNLVSIKKISDSITSYGRKISTHTVEGYLSALTDSYILYKVNRYDIRGKQYLKTGEKYYIADLGLRYFLLGNREVDMWYMLENVIYLELIRRGYEVYVGKVYDQEVDFVVLHNGETEYYQVALTVHSSQTLARELSSLNVISDHNAKYLITLDDTPPISYNGIKQINAIDWLLS